MPVQINVAKSRSPRYPRLSVLTSVGYARKIYEGAHRSEIDSDTAYRVMGFAGKNGASATALGALRQFGLVDGLRGDLRISDLALRILEPSCTDEYVESLHEAANKPDVFEAVLRQFPEGLPSSDEAVRSFLIRNLQFSRAGADDLISSLRETLSELEAENSRNGSKSVSPEIQSAVGVEKEQPERSPPKDMARSIFPAEGQLEEFIRIPLTRDCNAELRLSGPITDDAIARLIKYIDLMKDVWTESPKEL